MYRSKGGNGYRFSAIYQQFIKNSTWINDISHVILGLIHMSN